MFIMQALAKLMKQDTDFNKHLIHVLTKLTPEDSVYESALGVLHKICEDSLGDEMDEAHFDVIVIPKLLQFSQHSSLKIRLVVVFSKA